MYPNLCNDCSIMGCRGRGDCKIYITIQFNSQFFSIPLLKNMKGRDMEHFEPVKVHVYLGLILLRINSKYFREIQF